MVQKRTNYFLWRRRNYDVRRHARAQQAETNLGF